MVSKPITAASVRSKQEKLDFFRIGAISKDESRNVRNTSTQSYKDHIAFLVQRMLTEGFAKNHPILGIFNPETKLIDVCDGFCRTKAAQIVYEQHGIDLVIPVVLMDSKESEAVRIERMLVDNSGLPLTPAEKGEVARKLKSYGWTLERIGQAFNPVLTLTQVRQALNIGIATEDSKQLLAEGVVKATSLAHLVSEHGADRADEIVKTAIALNNSSVTEADLTAVTEMIDSGQIEPQSIIGGKTVEQIAEKAIENKRVKKEGKSTSTKVSPANMSIQELISSDPDTLAAAFEKSKQEELKKQQKEEKQKKKNQKLEETRKATLNNLISSIVKEMLEINHSVGYDEDSQSLTLSFSTIEEYKNASDLFRQITKLTTMGSEDVGVEENEDKDINNASQSEELKGQLNLFTANPATV